MDKLLFDRAMIVTCVSGVLLLTVRYLLYWYLELFNYDDFSAHKSDLKIYVPKVDFGFLLPYNRAVGPKEEKFKSWYNRTLTPLKCIFAIFLLMIFLSVLF